MGGVVNRFDWTIIWPHRTAERELYEKKMKKRKRGEEGETGGKSCGPEESKRREENMVRRNRREINTKKEE